MKVLQVGKDLEWEREIECPHGKSKLLVCVDDVKYDGIIFHTYYVCCHEGSSIQHKLILMSDNPSQKNLTIIPEHVRLVAERREREYRTKKYGKKENN